MKALMGLIAVLSVPLMILNMLGGLVSGIWLAILGEWGAIGFGILLLFVSHWLLAFALMPSMPLYVLAAHCAGKGKTFGLFCFSALGSLYIYTLITVWCCGILYLFVKDATVSSLIPLLIWSYGAATGPWGYMAYKDRDSAGEFSGSAIATIVSQFAYIVLMLLVIFTPLTVLGAIKVFGGVMLVGLVVQMSVAVMFQKEQKRLVEQSSTLDE